MVLQGEIQQVNTEQNAAKRGLSQAYFAPPGPKIFYRALTPGVPGVKALTPGGALPRREVVIVALLLSFPFLP